MYSAGPLVADSVPSWDAPVAAEVHRFRSTAQDRLMAIGRRLRPYRMPQTRARRQGPQRLRIADNPLDINRTSAGDQN